MVTEYFVCSASSPQKLQDTVKAAIANGWQPFGCVAATRVVGDTTLYQVVVKFSP